MSEHDEAGSLSGAEGDETDARIKAYARGLIEDVASVRLPELFAAEHPGAVYRIPDRHGVSVFAVRTGQLTHDQLVTLMRYRLAQYLHIGFIDARYAWEAGLEHEPLENLTEGDLHVVAGSVATGEILCYATLKSAPKVAPRATLRERVRPLLPVEKIHGWGVFNRVRLLPDLPLYKVRELGRFVKNQRLHMFDELGVRGPMEVGVALFRSLAGPLRLEVEAVVGDLEEGVAKQNLEYFYIPMVVIHGTVPYEEEASFFFPRYQENTVYPFACLASDFSGPMLERLAAVEGALEQPGKKGLTALFALKRADGAPAKSSLEPPAGLESLVATPVPDQGGAMRARFQLLEMSRAIRAIDPFAGFSVAEAAVLGTFLQRTEVPEGTTILRQGDLGDDLYLVESGQAEVLVRNAADVATRVRTLGPGDYFGEIALLTGGERSADVVSLTPMRLLQLSKESYTRYLAHVAEVEQHLSLTAMRRLARDRVK